MKMRVLPPSLCFELKMLHKSLFQNQSTETPKPELQSRSMEAQSKRYYTSAGLTLSQDNMKRCAVTPIQQS